MPATGGTAPCAPAGTGSAPATKAAARAACQRAARLLTALPQLVERDELVTFGADAVDQLFQRLDAELGLDQHRMPEERGPCIAHHLVQPRGFQHLVDVLRLAAVARQRHVPEVLRPDMDA